MRLAEIYLNYAEACNEKEDRDAAEALKYLNKIRERAGITQKLEAVYPQVLTSREELRKYIRQSVLESFGIELSPEVEHIPR